MYDLIIYDTSNFIDFPIGGQLTSIRNFLKYLANFQNEYCKKVLLIGITNEKEEVGKLSKVMIDDKYMDFLPVIYRDKDLSNVKNSLRMQYVKGLLKYLKRIKFNRKTLNYIHTPEAIIALKIKRPRSKYIVFSHGSYFNMIDGFRFYKKRKLMMYFFNKFIIYAIKHAKLIFTLDDDSTKKYLKYNKKVIQTNNSIVIDETIKPKKKINYPIRLLFVGRLSKVKGIENIIKTALKMDNSILKIVGDGEELNYLKTISNNSDRIEFIGSVKPNEVKEYMKNSDILIMNSLIEGKPMTIIEAMSYGLPIVTTNVGGIGEIVNNHIDSEVTNGTVDDILNCINKISMNYNDYSKNALINSKKYDYRSVNMVILNQINNVI